MSGQIELGAPTAPGADQAERLLEGLNPPQREAVVHGEGPLLVLAGAGSGKTRVLTHRIAYLVATGLARPSEILAITFTNKAAQEMRERVEGLVGRASRLMWVMTFHSACARLLRSDAERLGYKRSFTIYDEADSRRMVKRCMDELEIDPKRFNPRAVRAQISAAKNRLVDAADFRAEQGSFFEETVADVYELYEKRMHAANAMDFDDLLVRTVNLLELFPDVRERYRKHFRWVLVDEYQDTNRAQYRMLQLLSEEHRNLTVVGDDAQCLPEGTDVLMGDGTHRPIEKIRCGDRVMSSYGSGDFRPAEVTGAFRSHESEGVGITTSAGRRLESTLDHMHFAGYRLGSTPQMHMTYLMWRRDMGYRVGTTRVYTDGQRKPIAGFRQRCFHEAADAVWVLSTHETEAEARAAETIASLRYSIPTLPFVARSKRAETSLVGNQKLLDDVFSAIDSDVGGLRLLRDQGHSFQHPHHHAGTFAERRRVLTLTLCGEKRGATQMHRVSMHGSSPRDRGALEAAGFSVRAAREGSESWRLETCVKDFGEALRMAGRIEDEVDVAVRIQGRFGPSQPGRLVGNSLQCLPASSVRPGMAMFAGDGSYDIVESVERIEFDRPVYDINVEGTHNFVANGLVTHNSVYGFRHADIRNILDFEKDFTDAEVVRLEQNYRSTGTVLDAANALIANNREQKPKHLWTDAGRGVPITLAELDDEHAEARYVAGEIERLLSDEGMERSQIAVFYRVNAQSRVLEDTLVRFDVAYQVIGGTKFYDRAEIKDAIAYLTVLSNPADTVSFSRVINSPRRGIGDTTQGRILSQANTTGQTVWEVMAEPERIPTLGSAAVKAVSRFAQTMESLRERIEDDSVGDVLEAVLTEAGVFEALEAERTIESEGRIENLQELIGVAREFDSNREVEGDSPETPVEEFLAQISLLTAQDSLDDPDEGLVTLMTLHNAKGLEYDAVFILGCEEGVFPHSRSVDEGNLEEERRLCYVGITRARERLYMTYAQRRSLFGGQDRNLPSRFLSELPEELIERKALATRMGWSSGGGGGLRLGGGSYSTSGRLGEGGGGPERRQPQAPLAAFKTGDDVVHATFGGGVVTGVEPGSVVVVRFADDGAERRLMADYAPLRKAS
ncbi:UvrD-helicase domain-containing protein [Thermoleophilia bacterium SCSIO 60948]|nr:UvrD-helicase domain-containing protein [Thermoleophilia bacterium SCSIO 60948]